MISRFFIHHPIAATVISLVIVLAGAVAQVALPVAKFPDVTPPTVQVTCFYPGANPQVIAETVASPIEQEVNGVEMLIDPVTGRTGFALNANVMKVARGPITDLHMLLDVNQKQMEQMNLTVDRFEVVERDGVEVLEGEYHGKIGRMASMHFLLLGYLRGEQQVFVTVTSSDKLWEKHEGELRELVAGIRIAKE